MKAISADALPAILERYGVGRSRRRQLISGYPEAMDLPRDPVRQLHGRNRAVLEVLRTPEKQSELSKLGREMCATDLSRDSLGRTLESCYEAVIEGRPRSTGAAGG